MNTNEVIKLGNIWGYDTKTTDFAGNVFDISGISPAVTTCQGGGREPHILLINKVKNERSE